MAVKVGVGNGLTVLTGIATFCVVAPVLVCVIFPLEPLVAAAVWRTKIVVVVTIPPICGKFNEPLKVPPEVVEISKPVGAATTISPDKFVPETV